VEREQTEMTLSDRYAQLLKEIALACKKAERDPREVHVVAVTKNATLAQMQQAYALGIRDFGESRLQAALPKISLFPSDVVWHFVGALQSNKIGKIVAHFDCIHSVASLEMARLIALKSKELNRRPRLFLQVNTSGEASKGGFTQKALLAEGEEIARLNLNVIGLMTMAPLTADAVVVRECFHRLRLLRDALPEKTQACELSMGMSEDFLLAVSEGATFLRIGTYLFSKTSKK
jgi:PLP dependent protein